MKKKLIYFGTSLLLLSITATYGQDNADVPRRTAEEQAAIEKSVIQTPPNAGTLVDPKMDPAQVLHESPTNWKAAPLADEDNIAPEVNQPEHKKGINLPVTTGKDQPAGVQPQGKTTNLRDVKGEKTQTDAPAPGRVTSLRDLKGSKTQAEGTKPQR